MSRLLLFDLGNDPIGPGHGGNTEDDRAQRHAAHHAFRSRQMRAIEREGNRADRRLGPVEQRRNVGMAEIVESGRGDELRSGEGLAAGDEAAEEQDEVDGAAAGAEQLGDVVAEEEQER